MKHTSSTFVSLSLLGKALCMHRNIPTAVEGKFGFVGFLAANSLLTRPFVIAYVIIVTYARLYLSMTLNILTSICVSETYKGILQFFSHFA